MKLVGSSLTTYSLTLYAFLLLSLFLAELGSHTGDACTKPSLFSYLNLLQFSPREIHILPIMQCPVMIPNDSDFKHFPRASNGFVLERK